MQRPPWPIWSDVSKHEFCSIYLDGLGGMTNHLKHAHGKLARIFQIAAGLWRSLPHESPCMLCTKSFTEGHCCPVLYQVAICHLLDSQLTDALDIKMQTVFFVQPCDTLKRKPQCAHCLAEFPSILRLRDHILQQTCLFFFLRLPNGQYGPVSQLSRSEKCCTGPFNWAKPIVQVKR